MAKAYKMSKKQEISKESTGLEVAKSRHKDIIIVRTKNRPANKARRKS